MTGFNVALIMDGNRRWAKQHALQPFKGHKKGAEKLEEILEWCKSKDIHSVTLYAFSTENFKRSEEEKNHLFALFEDHFKRMLEKITSGEITDTRIKFLGNLSLFPDVIKDLAEQIEALTSDQETNVLQFCIGYGGRQEIVHAVKDIIKKGIPPEDVNEDTILQHLYTPIEPDIVIRTSGEVRTSNFLPFQATYAEWFFTPTLWPDFGEQEFEEILDEFKTKRKRRNGK